MSAPQTPNSYHHCYLLQSQSNKNKTYIGYTTNPSRRISQHNGIIKGGAKETSRNRPWKFVCVVGGFQNNHEGLKFEWSWQNPKRSTIFRSAFDIEDGSSSGGDGGACSNKGSDKALVDVTLKSIGSGLRKQLNILIILLCQSQMYKHQNLQVNFMEKEKESTFRELLYENKDNHMEDDEIENQWCVALPDQMECKTITSLEEMPFLLFTRKRNKREHDSKENRIDEECQPEEKKENGILNEIDNALTNADENGSNHILHEIYRNVQNLSLMEDNENIEDDLDDMDVKVSTFNWNHDIEILDSSSEVSWCDKEYISTTSDDVALNEKERYSNMSSGDSSSDGTIDLIDIPKCDREYISTASNVALSENERYSNMSAGDSSSDETIDLIDTPNTNKRNHKRRNEIYFDEAQIIDLTSPLSQRVLDCERDIILSDSDCTIDLCSI